MSDHDLQDDFANLSDEEINTLYEIVQLAEEKSGTSFGPALFASYDEVVARDVTSGPQSSRLFPFICRMLVGRKQDETIMDRFVGLLGEAGITVTPEDLQSASHTLPDEYEEREDLEPQRLGSREGPNGVLSSAETLHGEEDPARTSFGTNHGTKAHDHTFSKALPVQAKRRSQSEDMSVSRAFGEQRGRMNSRVMSAMVPHSRHRRHRSISSTRSLRITRPPASTVGTEEHSIANGSGLGSEGDSYQQPFAKAAEVPSIPKTSTSPRQTDARPFLPPELFKRSEEEMDDLAEVFLETKATSAHRGVIGLWAHRATQVKAQRDQVLAIAENFERMKLLKRCLATWRQQLDLKRLEGAWKDRENVYSALEETAVREREINLKWVAFSHWRNMAKEEKQRTSVARRHILRKRYFTAWSTLTAVNELKIRHFVLRNFLNIWHGRLLQVQAEADRAAVRYDRGLMQKSYRKWMFGFFEGTALGYHERKVEVHYFNRWREITVAIRQRDHEVEDMHLRNVLRKALLAWQQKAKEVRDMKETASRFRKQKVFTNITAVWKREAVLAPKALQLGTRVDKRILATALSIWRRHAQMERQAEHVQNQRVMRNAFTAWNDQLRVKYLQGQIDIRLKMDTLRTWILAGRASETQRSRDVRAATTMLHIWMAKAQNRQRSIEGAERTFAISQARRTKSMAFQKLVSEYRARQHLEAEAENFGQASLLRRPLEKWRQRNADVDLLNRKADAAKFYILTTRTLSTWSAATKEHQKLRKREAYAYMRRLCKMNLAREMLRRMQIQLAHIRNMERHAAEFQEDAVVKRTIGRFRSWKDQANLHVQQEEQAEQIYERKLLIAALGNLRQRHNQLQEMSTQAREFSAGSAAVEALTCLRKLDRRLFQVSGQEQWAQALREKHWEKHVKNMIRYWRDQAVVNRSEGKKPAVRGRDRVQERAQDAVFRKSTASAAGLGDLSVFDNTTWNLGPLNLDLDTFRGAERADEDVAFEDHEGIMTSTPLPGYLRTPSKRETARAKARERVAATASNIVAPPQPPTNRTLRFADQVAPASAPPRQQTSSAPPVLPSPHTKSITPFERKLREQGYPPPSASSRFGRGGAAARFGASLGSASGPSRRFGTNTPARGQFTGFDDIAEVSEDRSRDF